MVDHARAPGPSDRPSPQGDERTEVVRIVREASGEIDMMGTLLAGVLSGVLLAGLGARAAAEAAKVRATAKSRRPQRHS